MKTKTLSLFSLAAMLLVVACSDSTGAGTGQIEALIADNPGSSQPAPSFSQAAPADASSTDSFTGSVSGSVQVAISADGATWINLGSPANVTASLQSGEYTTVHGRVSVPVGTYAHVRVTLRNVQANLAAGSNIGGTVLTTTIGVMLGGGDQEVVCEKQVTPFVVRADAQALIRFDLNAETWINSAAIQAQSVADAMLQAAVSAGISGS